MLIIIETMNPDILYSIFWELKLETQPEDKETHNIKNSTG